MKKIISSICLFFLLISTGVSQVINDVQIINPDSEIYYDIKALQMDNSLFFFTQNTPISVGELKHYLKQLDYDSLTDYSKNLYNKIYETLYTTKNLLPFEEVKADVGVELNVEFYGKTNKEINWNHKYYYKDNLLTFPIQFGFGNLFYISSDLFVGKNSNYQAKPESFTNIPLSVSALNFNFPIYAYGSFGKDFDKWGYNFHLGKQGKTIGDTITGSVLYNSTFETDSYAEFVIYSDYIKYTCDVVQLSSNRMDLVQTANVDRYMYIHQYDFRLFKKAKFSVFEGSLICNPFSLRFLNPLVIMHQYGGWRDYNWPAKYVNDSEYLEDQNKFNTVFYRETNFCAYFAGMFELLPANNLRLYGIYSQIELQVPWELKNERGRYMPNSFALQIGTEKILPVQSGTIDFGIEAVYTSPYMYIKQTPSASLYRFINDMQSGQKIYSWIGTPFGPNCLAGQLKMNYRQSKWNVEFDYIYSMKGPNDFGIFETKKDVDSKTVYAYYPSVRYILQKIGKSNEDTDVIYKDASSLGFGYAPVITNQFALQGTYCIFDNLSVSGRMIYELVLNSNHVNESKDSGIEFSVAFTYKIK